MLNLAINYDLILRIKISTHQMSLLVPCPVSLTTSGAIQYGVPLIDFSRRLWLSLAAAAFDDDVTLRVATRRLAQPKSISLMTPLCISMMLPPLISLFEGKVKKVGIGIKVNGTKVFFS